MALQTFRDTIRRISPWWLTGTLGGRLLYAIGLMLDVLGDMLNAAVRARFPNVADPSALVALGRERRIQRGRAELATTYAGRLITWLDSHRTRGGPYSLLAQLFAFWRVPVAFAITLVYASGRYFAMSFGGIVTRGDAVITVGDAIADWARWELIFFWPYAITLDGTWGSGGTWDDGGIWDIDPSSLDAAAADDVRLVPREWNAAHCKGAIVLLAPGAELWDTPPGLWSDAGVWGDGTGVVRLDPDA